MAFGWFEDVPRPETAPSTLLAKASRLFPARLEWRDRGPTIEVLTYPQLLSARGCVRRWIEELWSFSGSVVSSPNSDGDRCRATHLLPIFLLAQQVGKCISALPGRIRGDLFRVKITATFDA